jgi:hypothetical protein
MPDSSRSNLSFVFILFLVLGGCVNNNSNPTEREFVYDRYRDGVSIKHERRLYRWSQDTIEEDLIALDSLMKPIHREKRILLRTHDGLDILINGKRTPYLKLDSTICTKFAHFMGFSSQTCFRRRLDYKNHKLAFEYTEQNFVIDGGRRVIYLDENYAVIDIMTLGAGSYDSLIRSEG